MTKLRPGVNIDHVPTARRNGQPQARQQRIGLKQKGRMGILIRIADEGDEVVLSIDDVKATADPALWKVENPYTEQKYSRKKIEGMSLSKKQFEDLGVSVVARINAFLRSSRSE